MSHVFTPEERRRGYEALRDGVAAEYEKRTGKSYHSSISKGRKPRARTLRKEMAGRPVPVARPFYPPPVPTGGAEML